MRTSLLFLSLSFAVLAGCSASSSDAGPATNDSDFTSERAAPTGEVAAFTEADKPAEYGARVRVSFAGAATQELTATAAKGADATRALRFSVGVGRSPANLPVFMYFGAAGEKKPAVGTYSCADGDAVIFEAQWNSDGTAKPARNAPTCSVIIDEIKPGPSAHFARAYGRFEATAAAPDGFSSAVKGAFLADIPIDE